MTTLISAIILYLLGTGSVKGFATMLIVSTLTTLLLIVFVARFLLGLLVKSGCLDNRYELFSVRKNDVPDVSKNEERRKFPIFRKFDFVGKRSISSLPHWLSSWSLPDACSITGSTAKAS